MLYLYTPLAFKFLMNPTQKYHRCVKPLVMGFQVVQLPTIVKACSNWDDIKSKCSKSKIKHNYLLDLVRSQSHKRP